MNVAKIDAANLRAVTKNVAVASEFPARWSPRAMAGTPLTLAEILPLLEAARWAPSCFNAQPWRFAYALNGSPAWQPLFDTLIGPNQAWVQRAGALIAVIARSEFEHTSSASRSRIARMSSRRRPPQPSCPPRAAQTARRSS